MSEKDLFDSIVDQKKERKNVVKDDRGNPANEHAKKLAKEASTKKVKLVKTIYTVKDGKVLRIDVKPNGSYSSYIGNYKKNKEQINVLIKQWEKESVWVPEHQVEESISKIIAEFTA